MEAVPASGPYYWESLGSDKDDLGQKMEGGEMKRSSEKYFAVLNFELETFNHFNRQKKI